MSSTAPRASRWVQKSFPAFAVIIITLLVSWARSYVSYWFPNWQNRVASLCVNMPTKTCWTLRISCSRMSMIKVENAHGEAGQPTARILPHWWHDDITIWKVNQVLWLDAGACGSKKGEGMRWTLQSGLPGRTMEEEGNSAVARREGPFGNVCNPILTPLIRSLGHRLWKFIPGICVMPHPLSGASESSF